MISKISDHLFAISLLNFARWPHECVFDIAPSLTFYSHIINSVSELFIE